MNILQIISSKSVGGGSQEHTRFLSLGLQQKGHRVQVICRPGSLVEAYRKEGLEVYPLELREKRKAVETIRNLIKKESIGVVHTHNRDADIPGLIAARKEGVPVIVSTIHAFINRDKYGSPKMNFPLWKYNRILKKIPHRIITVSNAVRQDLIKKLVLGEQKVTTILNAVDLSGLKAGKERQKVRQELGIPPEAKVVGAVGNLIAIKGHEYFIKAAPQILRLFPDTKFLLVGDGNQRDILERKIRESGLEKTVIFAGYRDDVTDILQIMDIFVHPSLLEALPRAVMEASGIGIPVVATEVGGTPEVVNPVRNGHAGVGGVSNGVKDKETGLLVPPRDSDSLAWAIVYLLQHPEKAEDMGRAGKEWINNRFDAQRMVDETESLLQQLLEENPEE